MNRLLITVLTLGVAPLALAQTVELSAATVPSSQVGAANVRIRWKCTKGWLKPGFVALYRTGPTPVTAVKPVMTSPKIGTVSKGVLVAKLPVPNDDKATSLVGVPFRTLKLVSLAQSLPNLTLPPLQIPPSAAPIFLSRAKDIESAFKARKPFAPTPAQSAKVAKSPVVPPLPPMVPAMAAVRTLSIAAGVSPQQAETLALGTTDENLKVGETVSYQLYAVDASGAETLLDTLPNFLVSRPTGLPEPAPLMAADCHDGGKVWLRWTRPTAEKEAEYLQTSYDLYRTQGTGPRTKINAKPILIGDLGAGQENPVYWTDKAPKPGRTLYDIVMHDGFGRESGSCTVTLDIADWRIPSPPGTGGALSVFNIQQRAQAATPLNTLPEFVTPKVNVGWVRVAAPADLTASYDVYRRDLDQPNSDPVKLTGAPISGAPLPIATEQDVANAIELLFGADIAVLQNHLAEANLAPAGPNHDAAVKAAALALAKARAVATIKVKNGIGLEYVDSSVGKDHKYAYYVVTSFSNGNQSMESEPFPVDVPLLTPPPAPTVAAPTQSIVNQPVSVMSPSSRIRKGLSTRFQSNGGIKVHLSWNAVGGPGMRYSIERSVGDGAFVQFALTDPEQVQYDDILLKSRKRTVHYRVTPKSRWGVTGLASKAVDVSIPSTLPADKPNLLSVAPGDQDGTLVVSFGCHPEDQGVDHYVVKRDGHALPNTVPWTKSDAPLTCFDTPGDFKPHTYVVVAVTDGNVNSPDSDALSGTPVRTSLPTVQNVRKASDGAPGTVTLAWDAQADAAVYIVRRRTGTSQTYDFTVKVSANRYVDQFIAPGKSYVYEVVAVDATGAKSQSPGTVSVTT